jgi:hypothetical protein
MKPLKIVAIDNGLYIAQIEALSDGGRNEVILSTPWGKPFPTIEDKMKGYGYGNLKKELGFFDHVEDADMIVNFDVSNNDVIRHLRKIYPEKSIVGAGRGEKLEHDRVFLKKWLEHYGLPVGPYKVIKGMTALINYLKNNPKKYVKNNIFRDDTESFFFNNWDDDKQLLDERAMTFGILKEEEIFVVEDPIEAACQSGIDMFFTDGQYIPFSFGFEISKNLCVNKVVQDLDEVPDCLRNNFEPLAGLMKRCDYRGPISTEDRVVSKDKSYLIDFTARIPAPMGQMYSELINNWTEVNYKIGKNEYVEVDCDHDYIGSFALSSEHAATNNVKLIIDPKYLKDVRPQMVAQNEDGLWALKGNTVVCCLIAGGKNPKEVISKLKEASKHVDAYSLDKDAVDSIDAQFEKALKGFESVGLKF